MRESKSQLVAKLAVAALLAANLFLGADRLMAASEAPDGRCGVVIDCYCHPSGVEPYCGMGWTTYGSCVENEECES